MVFLYFSPLMIICLKRALINGAGGNYLIELTLFSQAEKEIIFSNNFDQITCDIRAVLIINIIRVCFLCI